MTFSAVILYVTLLSIHHSSLSPTKACLVSTTHTPEYNVLKLWRSVWYFLVHYMFSQYSWDLFQDQLIPIHISLNWFPVWQLSWNYNVEVKNNFIILCNEFCAINLNPYDCHISIHTSHDLCCNIGINIMT